jgi:hypothetical protein
MKNTKIEIPTHKQSHCDASTTIEALKKKAHITFDIERDWTQFHSLKNLSMNIATEAAELIDFFLNFKFKVN